MPIKANLCPNGYFGVPRGYPVTIWDGLDTFVYGYVPPTVETITATLKTSAGKANAHMAIYTPPATTTAADGALVLQKDITGLTSTEESLTLTLPAVGSSSIVKQAYVMRIWVDSFDSKTPDTVDRNVSGATTDEAAVPVTASITSIVTT